MKPFGELLEAHFEATVKAYRCDPAINFIPRLSVMTVAGKLIVLAFPGPTWNDYRYEMLAEAARTLGRERVQVAAVFMATEAWLSEYPADEIPENYPPPSQDPNRQEAIIVTGMSADALESGHVHAIIERDAKGLATLQEPQCFKGSLQYKDYLLRHFLTVYVGAYLVRPSVN